MAYVPVPKDLTKIKTKVALNLTKRQIICFGATAIVGVPLFFVLKGSIPQSAATFIMVLVMLPFFMFAMYEKHGQPLEIIIQNIVKVMFLSQKERPYQTTNYYAILEKQQKLNKEVNAIVKANYQRQKAGQTKGKAVNSREEKDSRPHKAGKRRR